MNLKSNKEIGSYRITEVGSKRNEGFTSISPRDVISYELVSSFETLYLMKWSSALEGPLDSLSTLIYDWGTKIRF